MQCHKCLQLCLSVASRFVHYREHAQCYAHTMQRVLFDTDMS